MAISDLWISQWPISDILEFGGNEVKEVKKMVETSNSCRKYQSLHIKKLTLEGHPSKQCKMNSFQLKS